ncbi:uncharacterized protein JCM6883_001031 [Sporobolomyces salmoneus]|uniref:uncharacterized protein n=1 Tax=Sporobolomyces salmoneus TaxID=183962 RepID=UPI00317D8212
MSTTSAPVELEDLSPRAAESTSEALDSPPETSPGIDKRALISLLAQHSSSTWGQRCFEFASYLFLIHLYPRTTLEPSIFGFFTTGAAIVFAGTVGSFVDRFPRLQFVRATIVVQKATVAAAYVLFLISFLEIGPQETKRKRLLDGFFAIITILSALLNLATIGISVAVERDWVTCIAQGNGAILTKLNTYLRRIDLLSKLVAPLFVSLLTTAVSYTFAASFLLGFALISLCFEFIWIKIVYRRLPILAETQKSPSAAEVPKPSTTTKPPLSLSLLGERLKLRIVSELKDWLIFIRSPVFFSCLSISLLYLTVLSFDGSMLAYLKANDYSDGFVAGMRGVGVVTGLMGTVLMPFLEKRIGLVRAGSWSIWSEVITLIPAVLAFFVSPPKTGNRGLPYNSALLFTGMALSRIGLWSFDLCQLKELQEALNDHPRKNTIMALQFSLQNCLDLIKYVVTIIFNKPEQFKWAVVISFASVILGALCYLIYVRKERGHLIHLNEWTERLLLTKKQK